MSTPDDIEDKPYDKAAVQELVRERVARERTAAAAREGLLKTQLGTLQGRVSELEPLANEATTLRNEIGTIRTRGERDEVYRTTSAALLTDDHTATRASIEALYDVAPPDPTTGQRPAFAAWFAADPLVRAAVGALPPVPPVAAPSVRAGTPAAPVASMPRPGAFTPPPPPAAPLTARDHAKVHADMMSEAMSQRDHAVRAEKMRAAADYLAKARAGG